MEKTQKHLWAISAAIIVAGTLGFLLVPLHETGRRESFTIGLIAALFHFASVYYFMNGLKHFKAVLRIAYTRVALGIGFLGIAMAQLPAIDLFKLDLWVDRGGIVIPYVLSTTLLFAGVRKFAKIIQIRPIWVSWMAVILTAIFGIVLFTSLPRMDQAIADIDHKGAVGLTVITSTFLLFSAIGVMRIKQTLSASYSNAMMWFYIALLSGALAGMHYIGVRILLPANAWYTVYGISSTPFVVTGILFMKSGFAFQRIGHEEHTSSLDPTSDNQVSLIDLIIYVASLASNPKEIDSVLLGLREVTAHLKPGDELTEDDKHKLIETYNALEDYLIYKESLRDFSKEEIYANIQHHFKGLPEFMHEPELTT